MLEASASLNGTPDVPSLVTLAWHLRQRDERRSTAMMEHVVGECLFDAPPAGVERGCWRRALLVLAESRYLHGRLDEADQLARAVDSSAGSEFDFIDMSDARLLRALVVQDLGDRSGRSKLLYEAAHFAWLGGDALRADHAHALHAFLESYAGAAATEARWSATMSSMVSSPSAALRALASEFKASLACDRSKYLDAIRHYRDAAELAKGVGMVRRSIVARCCLGLCLSSLEKVDEALDELERALADARISGWNRCIGTCLLELGHVLLQGGRRDEAAACIAEAETALDGIATSLTALSLQNYRGELELSRAHPAAALQSFIQESELAQLHNSPMHQALALAGQARAFAALGSPAAAMRAAETALSLARLLDSARLECEALVLRSSLLAEIGDQDPTALKRVIEDLERAIEAAARMAGFAGTSRLHAALEAARRRFILAPDAHRVVQFAPAVADRKY